LSNLSPFPLLPQKSPPQKEGNDSKAPIAVFVAASLFFWVAAGRHRLMFWSCYNAEGDNRVAIAFCFGLVATNKVTALPYLLQQALFFFGDNVEGDTLYFSFA
jgi:hypothetical protein